MNGRPLPDDDRLLDLLAAQATEGLTSDQERQLEQLLGEHPASHGDDLALAAAAAHLVFLGEDRAGLEAMPESLRQRILDDAPAHLPHDSSAVTPSTDELQARRTARRRPAWLSVQAVGWYAAAAMLILALYVLGGTQGTDPAVAPTPLTLAEQRDDLLRSASDVVTVAWAPPEAAGFETVEGDVVWSNSLQRGFMRLRGMPANDPQRRQYQLWIVDPRRDANPIDGGVFDIASGGEQIVPIDAKLDVLRPDAFAITLEQPGGVVVSAGPLLVVAAVQS